MHYNYVCSDNADFNLKELEGMACSNMKNNADTLKFRNAYNTASK
jgi:hypothetical protein